MTIKRLNEVLAEGRKQKQTKKYHNTYYNGNFGIDACKESVNWKVKAYDKSLEELYGEFITRALTQVGFNINMILACEELMEK